MQHIHRMNRLCALPPEERGGRGRSQREYVSVWATSALSGMAKGPAEGPGNMCARKVGGNDCFAPGCTC